MRGAVRTIALILLVAFVFIPAAGVWAEEARTESSSEPSNAGQAQGAPQQQPQRQPPSPEEMQRAMQGMAGPMADMMGLMMEGMARTMAKREIAEDFATYTRNYYLALINRGFTEEEALKIVIASGIPDLGKK